MNDQESTAVDDMFADRRKKEEEVKQIETELEKQKHVAEDLMNNIDQEIQVKYKDLNELNEKLADDLKMLQSELEDLSSKKEQMESELLANPLKREAMQLYEKLAEVEAKKEALVTEIESAGTPEQQKERLLAKIKQDNVETGTMERQINEVKEQIETVHTEMEELEQEFEDRKGDKNDKYKECKVKEQQIDSFTESFEVNRSAEETKIRQLEDKVVLWLSAISKVTQINIPADSTTTTELSEDMSPRTLEKEYSKLHADLLQAEETEQQLNAELERSKNQIQSMQEEIERLQNVDGLEEEARAKRERLEQEKTVLENEVDGVRDAATAMQQTVSALRTQLTESENHQAIVALEQKLQHAEQGNYSLRETVESKRAETDIGPMRTSIMAMVKDYNHF